LHYRRGSPDIFPFPSAGREGYLIAVTACYSKTMPNQ
jgi:hypothetical protein